MWCMSASKEMPRLSQKRTAVTARKPRNTHLRAFGARWMCRSKSSLTVFRGREAAGTRTGRNTSTNRIVPTSIIAPMKPKSCRASAFSRSSDRKAPTVVMLPTSSGLTWSARALRLSGWYFRWST